ncbi:MAG: RNA polymerase sigma factor, partial [Gemmatimonadota bacterium]
PERFSAWLYQSALNAARDLQRQRRRHPVVSLDGGEEAASRDLPLAVTGPEQATDRRVGARDLRELLARALQGLSEEQRTVVIMKEYQELTFAEIAAVLEIPVNTAKSRLYHGLKSLRRQFEALGIGEEGLGHEL